MKQTQKIAVGGLLTALAAAAVIVSNVIPFGLYMFPAAAGVVVYLLSITAGKGIAWGSFFVVSLLSFFLCTNKEAPLCFILFLGYYPLLKDKIEKLHLKVLQYLIKLLILNAACICIYYLMLFVFSMPADSFEFFGINMPLVFLLGVNLVFLLYDYALTVMLRAYGDKINKFVTKMTRRF